MHLMRSTEAPSRVLINGFQRRSDIWMYLVEPETLRILTTNDPRIQMLTSSGSAQSSFLDHLSRSLAITAQQLRHPYAPPTAPPNLVRPVKIAGGDSSDLGAALIVLACIIAVLGFVGIVYHCCMWSRYVANKERIKRMCVAPRYEPVYADSSLKEYETQASFGTAPLAANRVRLFSLAVTKHS
ncbi:hypothetical protein HPB48_005167 [Haemaphysalis longicornis]|uniref:Uncharacterized protein n=1 Tax=Haemaphysalis longicornis TaxID=44386 RepID=A0A9J6FGX1_HAELO|nr:hypothetical protein HPB48_005167 [Haemaphysalis longicornis]